MKLLPAPDCSKHHGEIDPKRLREHRAHFATAIDAKRFPIISRHWNGLFVINGELAVNDHGRVPEALRHE
jgi:hypothetical protein